MASLAEEDEYEEISNEEKVKIATHFLYTTYGSALKPGAALLRLRFADLWKSERVGGATLNLKAGGFGRVMPGKGTKIRFRSLSWYASGSALRTALWRKCWL